MKRFFPILFFALCFAAGFSVVSHSWNGSLFVYMGAPRSPASVRSIRDYSQLDRSALYEPGYRQMLNVASVARREGFVGVNLGHPLLKQASGSDFACPVQGRPGSYDRVELTWTGVGVATSGDQPTMIVETACVPGDSLNQLATIWIPMQDIVSAPARDQEMQLFGDNPIVVRLESIVDQWPESWVLREVRLFNEADPEQEYTIDSRQIRSTNPLAFEYK